MNITLEQATQALSQVQDPEIKKDLITLNMARNIQVLDNNTVKFTLVLTTPACPLKTQIEDDCKQALISAGATDVTIETTAEIRNTNNNVTNGPQKINGVKNIIAVSSGKGGVGKSTVSVNLAISLMKTGAKVGILDADITAPNIPLMLNAHKQPELTPDGKKMKPTEAHGIHVISMGMIIDEDSPVTWRGPMMHKAINQFFKDVAWIELDYLIVDLPPGTSDAQISLCQSVPVAGAVIVSTPQEVALLDSRKALQMFMNFEVPILGLVENMSYFIAPDTGQQYDIFGQGGADILCKQYNIDCLGQIPLEIPIRQGGDTGKPITITHPDIPTSQVFASIAGKVAGKVSVLAYQS